MNRSKKIVIIGATSKIAEYCARLWLESFSAEVILVGRNKARMETIQKDLMVRSPSSKVDVVETDFLDPEAINSLVHSLSEFRPVDIALIAHGFLPDQSECQSDLSKCHNALEVNAISPVLFAEAFSKNMDTVNHGTIAIIGSVAGDRGRKSNYVYGSAKGMLERYAEGMQHRLASTKVKVVLIKPGPTESPMTAHLKSQGVKLASTEEVAKEIVDGIDKEKAVIYTPKKWQIIMLVIKFLPRFIFHKINI